LRGHWWCGQRRDVDDLKVDFDTHKEQLRDVLNEVVHTLLATALDEG
jgi:hypothetical protein